MGDATERRGAEGAAGEASEASVELSIVLPACDEEESLPGLVDEIRGVLEGKVAGFEIIVIDDGSRDRTAEVVRRLSDADPRIRLVRFGRNFGKSAALAAGFAEVRGRRVATLDADGQDNPAELPRMLAALEGGLDVVTGQKARRLDPTNKVIASRIFNRLVSAVTGVRVRDINSGYKVYRAEVTRELRLYGELYRFIPVLAAARGFAVGEIPVDHRARKFGRSKYGPGRLLRGFFDLMTVAFLGRFLARPLHFFGLLGVGCIGVGGAATAFFVVQWLGGRPMHVRPVMVLAWLLLVMGVQFITMGLLAELLLQRTHRPAENYRVAERYGASKRAG